MTPLRLALALGAALFLSAAATAQARYHLDAMELEDGTLVTGSFVFTTASGYGDIAIEVPDGFGATVLHAAAVPTFASSSQLSVTPAALPDLTGQPVFVAPFFFNGVLGVDPVVDVRLDLQPAGAFDCATQTCDLVLNDGRALESGRVLLLGAQFENLGGSLAGTLGAPALRATGSLTAGSSTTFSVSDGAPSATAFWVLGLTLLEAPFKGGVLVPDPDVVTPLPLDVGGGITFSFAWPAGLPAGSSTFHQVWVPDPSGPVGFTASNALAAITPP